MAARTAKKVKSRLALPKNESNAGDGAEKQTCFVISPFGGWFDSYYDGVFAPAIASAGLHSCRADDLYRPSSIVHDIWAYVQKARVLLADLTGKNPNVLYELGLAHAIGKPVIMITQVLDDVPFDLRNLRVITYDLRDPAWGEDLARRIERALTEVVAAPQLAVPPAFLHEREESSAPKVSPLEKKVLELSQEVDSLRRSQRSRALSIDDSLPPEEARALVERYVRMKMPSRVIIERLSRRGVPT